MATHSNILTWRIPWTEEPWWAAVHGVAKCQARLSDYVHAHTLEPSSWRRDQKFCACLLAGCPPWNMDAPHTRILSHQLGGGWS